MEKEVPTHFLNNNSHLKQASLGIKIQVQLVPRRNTRHKINIESFFKQAVEISFRHRDRKQIYHSKFFLNIGRNTN